LSPAGAEGVFESRSSVMASFVYVSSRMAWPVGLPTPLSWFGSRYLHAATIEAVAVFGVALSFRIHEAPPRPEQFPFTCLQRWPFAYCVAVVADLLAQGYRGRGVQELAEVRRRYGMARYSDSICGAFTQVHRIRQRRAIPGGIQGLVFCPRHQAPFRSNRSTWLNCRR